MTASNPTQPASILDEPALRQITGYRRRGDVERWLRRNGIGYYRGRGGALFTTATLLEAARLPQAVGPAGSSAAAIEF